MNTDMTTMYSWVIADGCGPDDMEMVPVLPDGWQCWTVAQMGAALDQLAEIAACGDADAVIADLVSAIVDRMHDAVAR